MAFLDRFLALELEVQVGYSSLSVNDVPCFLKFL